MASGIGATNAHFAEHGWVVVDFPDREAVVRVRTAILDFLRREALPGLGSLEDYHLVATDDEKHIAIQAKLAEFYWQGRLGPDMIGRQVAFFREFVGQDLYVQKFPYLRIARPGKPQDNISYHRDTWYGATAFELSVFVPFVDLAPEAALQMVSGSFRESEEAYPHTRLESKEVAAGSVKHKLGFAYAPHRLDIDISARITKVPMRVGQALIFGLSTLHGQQINGSQATRFSTDIRVVNQLAPVKLSRTVRTEYFETLSESAVTRAARRYYEANPTLTP